MGATAIAAVLGTMAGRAEASGSVSIDHQALVAYVADADASALHRVDLLTHEVTTTHLPCAPEAPLVVDGAHVAVTLRGCNQVAIVEIDVAGEGTVTATAKVAADPWGLALTPRGELLVTSAWGHTLTALDATTLDRKFSVNLPKEPRTVVVSRDGKRAFVTHVSSADLSVVDLVPSDAGANGGAGEGPKVRHVAALGARYKNRLEAEAGAGTLHPASALAFAAVFNEQGSRLFIPHLAVQNGAEGEHVISSGYGSVSVQEDTTVASVAVLAVDGERVLGAPAEGAAKPATRVAVPPNPRVSFAVMPEGSPARQARAAAVLGDALFVASLGTDELVELDARSLDPALAPRRVFAVGAGPTGVDVEPTLGLAVVYGQFSHDISVISVGSGAVEAVHVEGGEMDPELAAGRRLFFSERDRRTSRDGRACAACHPDGREDGLTWKLGGGPRQTPMLAARVERGPYGWFAEHATLEEHVSDTMTRLGGTGLPRADMERLIAYLRRGLVAPVRDVVADAKVVHGRELFVSLKTGCTNCHRVDADFSDHDLHDVSSQAKSDTSTKFRTPPLRFVEGTAPYFHDGRYPTLEALVADNLDRMGNTTQLTHDDEVALVAYLRTL